MIDIRFRLAYPATLALACAASFGTLPAQGEINPSLLAPLERTAEEAARIEQTPAAVVAAARAAVVHVHVEVDRGRDPFRIERPGSGVVISPSGLVLTLAALVAEAFDAGGDPVRYHTAWVQLEGGERLPARLVARDGATGLALLRAELPAGRELASIPLAPSGLAAPGDPAVVISHPDGKEFTVFAGIVARASGGIVAGEGSDARRFGPEDVLLTDAAIRPRSHGGALLDGLGRLLGICDASRVRDEVAEPKLEDLRAPSFGFAIPTDRARRAFGEHLPATATADDGEKVWRAAQAVASVTPSIVSVRAGTDPLPDIGVDDPYAVQRREGLGSGVIVDPSGLCLTNAHIVGRADRVTVALGDGREVAARVLKMALPFNVALLKLELPEGETVPAIQCGSSADVILGETVLGVGRPFGTALTVSIGVLSATRQGGRLQADPILGNANGGGALIDLDGRLIGIVDGGAVDKLEVAFMQRGDETKAETNLSFVPGIDTIREQLRSEIESAAGPDSSILSPKPPTPDEIALRRSLVTDVVDRTAGCLINVYVSYTSRQADVEDNPFAQSRPTVIGKSLGSGVIIDSSGLALSNWHVVDDATEPDGSMRPDHVVHARLRDGEQYEVRVLSISREDDLSLLQLVLPAGKTLVPVELGSSDRLRLGETAIAVGNPMGRANTITAGVISAKDQDIRIKRRWAKFEGLIETDAAINSGNSGGPLLDVNGELIGINSAGGSGFSVTGYAIPVDYVREKTLGLLMTPEKLRSVWLGMDVGDRDQRVVVESVDPTGPAARAGIEPGDRLLAMDDVELTWSVGYVKELVKKSAGGELSLVLERDGERLTKAVEPLSAAAWAVLRQTGVEAETLPFRDQPELCREALIAVHRKFTGDPTSAPTVLAEGVVRIDRVDETRIGEDVALRSGDLLMGVELERQGVAGSNAMLQQFANVAEVQRFFNAASIYEGAEFRAWVFRDGAVEVVPLFAKRLIL